MIVTDNNKIKENLESINTIEGKLDYLYFQKKELSKVIYAFENSVLRKYSKANDNLEFHNARELKTLIDDLKEVNEIESCGELNVIIDGMLEDFIPLFERSNYYKKYYSIENIFDMEVNADDEDYGVSVEIMDINEKLERELKIFRICENFINAEINYLNSKKDKRLNETDKKLFDKTEELKLFNYEFEKIKEYANRFSDEDKYKYYLRIQIEIKRVLNSFAATEFKNFDGNIYFELKEFKDSVEYILKKEKCPELNALVNKNMNKLKENADEKNFRATLTYIEMDIMRENNKLVKTNELVGYEIEYLEKLIGKKVDVDSIKNTEETKTRKKIKVSNEIIAEEVVKHWDNGVEELEEIYKIVSDESEKVFGEKLTPGQIKGRYQRYADKDKDYKRKKI